MEPAKAILSRPLDVLTSGGLSILVLLPILIFKGEWLDALLPAHVLLLTVLINTPHFAASYWLVYRSPELVRRSVDEAYERFRTENGGEPSAVYPALARVPPHLFGICAAGTHGGGRYVAGDAEHPFTIMSVAKPFVFATICQALGPDEVRRRLGVNATGLPFNSLTAVERSPDGRTNPMVNPGAISIASFAPGDTAEARWRYVQDSLSRFAGRPLTLDADVYASAAATNYRNRALADLLQSYGLLGSDPAEFASPARL